MIPPCVTGRNAGRPNAREFGVQARPQPRQACVMLLSVFLSANVHYQDAAGGLIPAQRRNSGA